MRSGALLNAGNDIPQKSSRSKQSDAFSFPDFRYHKIGHSQVRLRTCVISPFCTPLLFPLSFSSFFFLFLFLLSFSSALLCCFAHGFAFSAGHTQVKRRHLCCSTSGSDVGYATNLKIPWGCTFPTMHCC